MKNGVAYGGSTLARRFGFMDVVRLVHVCMNNIKKWGEGPDGKTPQLGG